MSESLIFSNHYFTLNFLNLAMQFFESLYLVDESAA